MTAYRRQPSLSLRLRLAGISAVMFLTVLSMGQTPNELPPEARGVVRLRVRIKVGERMEGLSRKRFYLIKGSQEQNKALLQDLESRSVLSRDCYYQRVGASQQLIRWLKENDCESIYCREVEAKDVEGNDGVPEFQKAVADGEKMLGSRDVARKWLSVYLPEQIRDGFYRQRQEELNRLIRQAETSSGAKLASVMTDTKGTAYFTDVEPAGYIITNLLPAEAGTTSLLWNCEIQVKPGDLSTERPFLISNTKDRQVKCVALERPLPSCEGLATIK